MSPAVAGAGDDKSAIDRHAQLVFNRRHEPGCLRILGMNSHTETEARRANCFDAIPALGTVRGFEHAVVMLDPQRIRLAGALDHAVRVLDVWIVAALRGHVVGDHAMGRL